MVRLRLLVLRWKMEAHSRLETLFGDVWTRSSFGYALITVACGICAWWYFHVPPPSYSVTLMAVAAGLMALRPEMSGREKWLWTLVLFAFAIVEIRAINHDRAEHDKEQARVRGEEAEHFQSIANGISNSIDLNQQNFKATLNQNQRAFDATMTRMGALMQTETGGHGFSYVTFVRTRLSNSNDFDNYVGLANHHGRYPLHGLTVRFVDFDHLTEIITFGMPIGAMDYSAEDSESFNVGNLSPGTSSAPLKIVRLAGKDWKNFNIFFSAVNGVWYEFARLRRVGTEWKQAIRVFRYGNNGNVVIFERVDHGYPLKDGKVEWGY